MSVGLGQVGGTGGADGVRPTPAQTIASKEEALDAKVNGFFGKEGTPKKGSVKSWALNKVVYSQKEATKISNAMSISLCFTLGTTIPLVKAYQFATRGVSNLIVRATMSKSDRSEIKKLQKEIKTETGKVEEERRGVEKAFNKKYNEVFKRVGEINKQISACIDRIDNSKEGVSEEDAIELKQLLVVKNNFLETEMKGLEDLEKEKNAVHASSLSFEDKYLGREFGGLETMREKYGERTDTQYVANAKSASFSQREQILNLQKEGKIEVDDTQLEKLKSPRYEQQVKFRLGNLSDTDKEGVKAMLFDYSGEGSYYSKSQKVTVSRDMINGLKPGEKESVLTKMGFTTKEIEAYKDGKQRPEREVQGLYGDERRRRERLQRQQPQVYLG